MKINGHPAKDMALLVARDTIIPELGFAIVPHDIEMTRGGSVVLLVREPGVFLERQLLVDSGPVAEGAVTTTVFNLSEKRIRLKRGECVSRLIAV